MASAQVVETVIRASEQQFRNKHDQLAFAVHAFLVADGYRLIATGKAADIADEEIPEGKKRSSVKGWNELEDGYAFRYEDPTGKRNSIMVKMVPLGDNLLLQWMAPKSFKEPRVLDLNVNDYVADMPSADEAADPVAGYKNLPDLVEKLKQTFHGGAAEAAAKQQPGVTVSAAIPEAVAPAAQSLRTDARMPGARDEAPDADLEVLMRDDPLCEGPRRGGFPPVPGIGTDDLHPPLPGIPREFPGPDDIPYGGGMGGRPGGLGGMFVGPDDPIFAGRFPDRGGGRSGELGPGSIPPGSRYDPIGPPGVPVEPSISCKAAESAPAPPFPASRLNSTNACPGFHPRDFQRGGRDLGRGDVHPDIMPPGPGRFDDSMFG